jgi:hypothetical protein
LATNRRARFEAASRLIQDAAMSAESDWELRHDEGSGQAFYVNVKTGESSWEPPTTTEVTLPPVNGDLAVQQQWAEAFDESGNAYYVNLVTMETRWTPPPSAGADSGDHQAAGATEGALTHRPRRPSTAEQMAELNRLLSGGDDDDEEEDDATKCGGDGPIVTSGQAMTATGGGCAWMMFVNEGDGQPYYYNHLTGECVWDPPEEFVDFHNQQQEEKSCPETPSAPVYQLEASIVLEDQAQGSISAEIPSKVLDGGESIGSVGADLGGNSVTDMEESISTSTDNAVAITPEFEDKVRRAIEAVSKTPIGSSRLLFVRTPTGLQLPFSTRAPDGSEQQRQPSQRLRPSSGTRPTSAAVGGPGSRPTSASFTKEPTTTSREAHAVDEGNAIDKSIPEASLTAESTTTSSETREIDQLAFRDVVDETSPGAPPLNAAELPQGLDSSNTSVAQSNEDRPTAAPEDAPHSSVKQPHPENALSIDVSEEKLSPTSPESEHLHVVSPETVASASVVVLQCAIRCFMARSKVRAMRAKRANKEEQASESESVLAEGDKKADQSEGDTSKSLDASSVDAILNSGKTTASAAERVDEDAVGKSPITGTSIPSEVPTEEAKDNSLPVFEHPDNNLAEIAPPELPESSLEQISGEPNTPSASPSSIADAIAPAELPTPVSLRRSPSRASTRSARLSIASRKRDTTCSVSTQCPKVLSLMSIFPVRSASTNAVVSADTADEGPRAQRKLPPWMQETMRPAMLNVTHQSDTKLPDQPSSIRAVDTARLSPDLLQQYALIYHMGQQKFEAERERLREERAEHIHSTSVNPKKTTNQDETIVKDNDSKEGLVCSSEHIWNALEMQDDDERASPGEDCVADGIRANFAVAEPGSTENGEGQMRYRRELEHRIKLVEGSINRVEARLEAAELCLVDDDDQASSTKRVHQAKYASKLRRRLRSLLSAGTYWRQVLLDFGKDSEKSVCCFSGEARLSEHRTWAGDSALHYAAWRGWHEQVLWLIKTSADVNRVDNSVTRWRPLHEASRGGHEAVVRALIAAGASLTAVDASGETALHVACRAGRLQVVRELLVAAAGSVDAASACRDFKAAVKKSVNSATAARAAAFFGIRNGKRRRAIDLATLPMLVAFLEGKMRLRVHWCALALTHCLGGDRIRESAASRASEC